MKKILYVISAILALFTIFALSSCGDADAGVRMTFIVDRENMQMSVGDTYTVAWTVIPTPDEPSFVSWKSSDTNVATCEGGVVRAVGEGKARITATHNSGAYEVIAVTVENDVNRLYMLEGETFQLENVDMNTVLAGAECTTSDTEIASVSKNDKGVIINASKSGRCDIRLETEKASIVYYNLIVLSEETAGVNVKTDEFPMTVNYDSGKFQSALNITNITVEKTATREFLDAQTVLVSVIYEFEKINDSDGDDALNPTEFVILVYTDEMEGDEPLRELAVHSGWTSVASKEKNTYTYSFYVDFNMGSGLERNFTFTIQEIGSKE